MTRRIDRRARRLVVAGVVALAWIRGANGSQIEAIYDMVWEGGRWKIGGGVSRPDDDVV